MSTSDGAKIMSRYRNANIRYIAPSIMRPINSVFQNKRYDNVQQQHRRRHSGHYVNVENANTTNNKNNAIVDNNRTYMVPNVSHHHNDIIINYHNDRRQRRAIVYEGCMPVHHSPDRRNNRTVCSSTKQLTSWSSAASLNSLGASLQQSSSGTVPPSSEASRRRCQRDTLQNRFDLIRTLGKGTYGKVKLARDRRTNEQVAIKTIKKSRIENTHDLERMLREIKFMSSLNHPHIVKIKEVYESKEKIILVMEYASGGELYEYLNRVKRISENEARSIFRQIVSAVHFLHKSRIVHRDLKLENILIDERGNIKLADFGLSNNWSPTRLLDTFCGSPLYASPEIVKGIPYYGPEVDCWSLGVLLYTLVYGSMPFQGGDYNRLVFNISSGQFIQPREKSGAYMLIKRCLCVDPARRATIDSIAEHWWVNIGYQYPPIVYHNYVPGASGIQARPYVNSTNDTNCRRSEFVARPKMIPSVVREIALQPNIGFASIGTTERYHRQ